MGNVNKKASSYPFGEIGHLRIVQRGKDKVQDLLEGSCIPSRLVYQMGIGPSRLEFGISILSDSNFI